MRTLTLTVGPDGRVEIPGARPGQTITVSIAEAPERADRPAATPPIPEAEQEAIKTRVRQRAKRVREALPEPWRSSDHGDLLYGEDGLPK